METKSILRQLALLPPEAQQQVLDFIAFLSARYGAKTVSQSAKQVDLEDEPFIGMWRNRKDLQDSTDWVRQIREREWQ
ncbi:MAG: DUF2281 domain-containing protein [Chloroflexi bacterium]|nr:DUF2281 domain-containing protein [Chloroflexota bacterium]